MNLSNYFQQPLQILCRVAMEDLKEKQLRQMGMLNEKLLWSCLMISVLNQEMFQ